MTLHKTSQEKRHQSRDPATDRFGWKLLLLSGKNFFILLVLFLALFCWIFGSLYRQGSHIKNLTIGFVDYDNGAIGAALRAAYTGFQSDSFPVIAEFPPAQYPTPDDLKSAVCRTDFWAAIWVSPGASDRLRGALGGMTPADEFDRSDILTYIWNEVRYPTVVDSAIADNLEALSSAARIIYTTESSTLDILNMTAPGAVSILVNPWQLNDINIQPTKQGPRVIYNTIVIVLVLVQDFFYLGMLNAIYGALKIWGKARPIVVVLVRFVNSLTYTLLSGLCVTGAIWAFRDDWNVNGAQFVLSWMIFWILGHINFFVLDSFTVWLPPPYVPMAMISWVLANVTSVVLPFDLNPAFYKLGYVFPVHAAFSVLLDIWSGGCNPQLPYALPTLFGWELVAAFVSAIGVYRRARFAKLGEKRQEESVKEEAAAVAEFERQREARELPQGDPDALHNHSGAPNEDIEANAATEEELAKVISEVDERIRQERRRSEEGAPMGYTIDLPFDGERGNGD